MFRSLTVMTALSFSTMLLLAPVADAQQDVASNVDLPRYPSISPDGEAIIFSWRGDLWKVHADGGMAVRLTSHPANETRSAWSPDGTRIAFMSDRTGTDNLYLMNADGTNVQTVSQIDRPLSLAGFGTDREGNEVLTFSSSMEGDVYRGTRMYMISTNGGHIARLMGAFGTHPVVHSGGDLILFERGGSSWTRRHYRGSDARDVWMYDRRDDSFAPLTTWAGNDGMAKWAGPRTVIYASDRELDRVNLYQMSAEQGDAVSVRITNFADHDVYDFDVSADGSRLVLSVWDTLYTLDLSDPNAQPRAIAITAVEDERDNYRYQTVNREVSEAALSPDGKVMAMVAYGEVFVRNTADNSPTRRVTFTHAREHGVAWSPDGLTLYFVSDEDGTDSIYSATVSLTRGEIKKQFEEATAPPKAEEPAADDGAETEAEEAGDEAADEEAAKEKEDAKDPMKDPARWHDAWKFTITPVVQTTENDRDPSPSPDGTALAFRRGRGDLAILNLANGEVRTLVEGWDTSISWRWSPNSKLIAYDQNDRNFNSDVFIVPADGSRAPVNITRHPDNDGNPRWSADGKILNFVSERDNEEYDLWMVFLDREIEALPTPELDQYFKDATDAAKKRKPLAVDAKIEEAAEDADPFHDLELDDAYLRLRRVTRMTGNEFNNEISPAGDVHYFTASGSESGLYSIKWDGSDSKRLTSSVSVQHLTLTGDKIVFVSGSRAGMIGAGGGSTDYIDISDRLRLDLQQQSSQKFMEAARILGENFYHPTMKDLDWMGLAEKYHALAMNTRTSDEFNYVAAYFLGELNGSHLGIRAPGESVENRETYGRLGIRSEPAEGGFRVTHIIPDGPAATGAMTLRVGDVITSIDLQPFEPGDTVESRLRGRIGEETIIGITRTSDDGRALDLQMLFTPISYGAENGLQYRAWQLENARRVHEWSDGRLGYLHIQGMNIPSLNEFERDLFAAAEGREGLIIDVRNNGGGHTADYVLSSIMVQPHAYTVPRGADPSITDGYPQDRLFIQRYILPINMMCNEKSFSNAEIVSHAFKTLGRGTLVGQTTYGGVISTGGTSLIDGTFVRLPFRGWYLPDGTDMENNGAVPDIIVPQTPEDESADHDAQLRAAVEDLLQRLN